MKKPKHKIKVTPEQWETGQRSVPWRYNNILSDIFGVTVAYLAGITDDPHEEVDIRQLVSDPRRPALPQEHISPTDLAHYNGEPV